MPNGHPTSTRFSVLLALAAAACGGAGGSDRAARGDLSGPDHAIEPVTGAVYQVGTLDGEEWETFGRLNGLGFDEAGNLYVFDADAGHITVIDPTGAYIRTFGESGDGPGEIQQPVSFALFRDGTSAIFDAGHRAVQLYASDGTYIRSAAFDPQGGLPGRTMFVAGPSSLVSTGGMRITSVGGGRQSVTIGGGDTRPIDVFSLSDTTKRVLYDAWNPPPPEGDASELSSTSGSRNIRFAMAPLQAFRPGLSIGALSDGRVAVVDSVDYRILLVGPDGTVQATFERPIQPIAVTEAIQEAERAVRLEAFEEGGGPRFFGPGGGGPDSDAMREMIERQIGTMSFLPEIPVIEALAVDWDDRLWVERAAPPGEDGPIDVIGPDGYYFGTIPAGGLRIPDAFGPDGLLAYVETDDLGVERVRVARLTGTTLTEADPRGRRRSPGSG